MLEVLKHETVLGLTTSMDNVEVYYTDTASNSYRELRMSVPHSLE
jgi:hypothetical protein